MTEINFGTSQAPDPKPETTKRHSIKTPTLNIPIAHNGKQGILLRIFDELCICKMEGDFTVSYFWRKDLDCTQMDPIFAE
jgi:hypothetical protein